MTVNKYNILAEHKGILSKTYKNPNDTKLLKGRVCTVYLTDYTVVYLSVDRFTSLLKTFPVTKTMKTWIVKNKLDLEPSRVHQTWAERLLWMYLRFYETVSSCSA